jgi:multidrug resistance efflux pump
VTDQDPPTTDPERTRSTARGAELRSELAITDARRAEEETAKAHEAVEEATAQEQKLSAKERQAQERAEAAEAEAEQARRQAQESARRRQEAGQGASGVSGANVASPGVGSGTDPSAVAAASRDSTAARPAGAAPDSASGAERPEVLAGAAFAGAFLLARILKRLVD